MERYKVVKRIGVGTYGSAYLVALKQNPGQQLVLKKIKLDDANEKERQQAETEISILLQLDHPLILAYVDHFLYKGHLCIITDYCEGGDLYQYLRARKSPLQEPQILEWLVQIVMAIQYVHQKSILHRDLKTQNIFITREGNIKLGDFGISRSLNSTVDLAATIIGTPFYMSPEVMSSKPYDYKSDMWSLGCVLYEMMSLKHAFDANDMSSLVLKILRGEHLPVPSQYSSDLKDIVKQLLSKNPKARPSCELILKAPFLKDQCARVRDTVAWLEHHKPSYIARRPLEALPSRNLSGASSGGPSGPGPNGRNLDHELDAARQRLRRIQAERDALREQMYQVGSGQAASGSSSPQRRRLSWKGGEQAVPIPPWPGSGGGPAPLSEEYAARRVSSHLSEDIDVALGKHRELRQQRVSRPQSPSETKYASPSTSLTQAMDPKARMEARKLEEARRREAELLGARKAYFEERKAAEAKARQQYQPSQYNTAALPPTHPNSGALSMRRRETDSSPMRNPSSGNAAPGAAIVSGSSGGPINGSHSMGHADAHAVHKREISAPELAAGMSGLHLYSSSSDSEDDYGYDYEGGAGYGAPHSPPLVDGMGLAGAQAEFEAELQALSARPPQQPELLGFAGSHTFASGDVSDRCTALRRICVLALGQPLFDMLYGYMRKRVQVSGASGLEDGYFKQELLQRLGPQRMQYVHLMDQLVYYEEMVR